MPIDPSISLAAKGPTLDSTLGTLSSLTQMGLQSQALKKAKATYGADVSQRQAESRLANTQADVAQQVAPETVSQQQIATQSAQSSLQDQQTKIALRTLSGLYQDPAIQNPTDPNVVHQKLKDAQALAIQSGADPKLTAPFFDKLHAGVDQNPGQIKQLVLNSMLQGIDAAGQQGAVQPHYLNTGKTLQQVNPSGVGPQAIGTTLAPGQQDTLAPDTSGGTGVIHRDAQGNITGATPVGNPAVPPQPNQPSGQPPAPNAAPMSFPSGETRDTQAALQADRQAANESARGIPTQMDNISQSLHVLDQPGALAKTGTGAAALAKIAGTVGVPVSGDYAANYNTIAHALAIQSGVAAKTMGAGTDAARAVQEVATGSVSQDPVSLRMALTTNRALLGGAADYNNGQEKAIQSKGIFGARQFKNDWSNNFDVELYRLHTAADTGDTKTVDEVKKRLGPDKLKALGQKWNNLQSLINTGALPNGQ